jgi:8-oxo-dGTP diphosphatase
LWYANKKKTQSQQARLKPMIENDRQRISIEKEQKVNFVDISNSSLPAFEKITSVLVVPFTPDGLIVCALLPRGIDLPGGHVQINEQTCEETARREAMEEAGITLGKLQLLKVLQSDYFGSLSIYC